jgi:hypothetical protein
MDGSTATWETPPTRRPRRRLLLPPICPVLKPVVSSLGSGSRFGVLDEEEGEVSLAEEVALRGMDDVPRVLPISQKDDRSNGELLDEFWSKIGFPTAGSRSWERKTTVAGSAEDPVEVRPRSLSPERSEMLSVRARPASASPPGLRLPKPQIRMKGWKGPLPQRWVTPPAVFADFVDAAWRRSAGLVHVDA